MIKKDIFEEFEAGVVNKIIEENTSINKILREQYKHSQIESRRFSGAGFFTHFKIPEGINRITELVEYTYGDVEAIINDIDGYSFILYIKNGAMTCLEGYTWRDSWPSEIHSYALLHRVKLAK